MTPREQSILRIRQERIAAIEFVLLMHRIGVRTLVHPVEPFAARCQP